MEIFTPHAGYLCDVPLKTLVGLMILEMERFQVVEVLGRDPMQLRILGPLPAGFTHYHQRLLDAVGPDGQGRRATTVTRFEGSFTRFPVLSEIAVTYRCNLACTFCHAGCETVDASPGNEAAEKYRGR